MPTWPSVLPVAPLLDGFSIQASSATVSTEMDAGPIKARRRFTAGFETARAAWLLDGERFAVFRQFYDGELASGALSFTAEHPIPPHQQVGIRFDPATPPTYTPLGNGLWRVEAQIMVANGEIVGFETTPTTGGVVVTPDASAFGTIAVAGQTSVVADQGGDTLTLAAGSNITITTDISTDTVTISATGSAGGNAFSTVAVAGQGNVVADSTADTLTLSAGSNITITTNPTTDTVTIAATGANAFGTVAVSGNPSVVADTAGDTLTFVAGANISIATDASGDTVTISAADAALQPGFGQIVVSGQSAVLADASNDTLTLAAGANITISTNAATDTITISGAGGDVSSSRQILTQHSLQGGGNLAADRTLSLVGDVASPGVAKVYRTAASGARGWQNRYDGPVFNVIDEGAVAGGSAGVDNQSAFQSAVTKAQNAGGGVVYVPPGGYRLNSSVMTTASSVTILGHFPSTTIYNGSTNQPSFLFQGPVGDRIFNNGIEGFAFHGATGVTGVSGQCAVRALRCGKAFFSRLQTSQFPNKLYDGVKFEDVSQSHYEWLQIGDTAHDGVLIKDCLDVFADNWRCDANSNIGIVVTDSEGFYWSAVTAYGNGLHACEFNAGAAADNVNGLFVNCVFDTSVSHNVNMLRLFRARFVNCWFSAQSSLTTVPAANGCRIAGNTNKALKFIACSFLTNNGHGVELVNVSGSGPDDVEFLGCSFGTDDSAGNANGKGSGGGYGLWISDPATRVRVIGGGALGNATGAIRNNSTGVVIGVTGYTPPAVTGSRGGNAALASLLSTLADQGLITNSTTA